MKVYIFISLSAVAFGISDYWDPMENDGLFEGDILLEPYELMNAVAKDSQLWPNGIVSYEISPELSEIEPLIRSAMDDLQSDSCVRFIKKSKSDNDYLWIHHGTGCFSSWGQKGGKQELSLGDGCHLFPIILHELMHILGLEHEHNRSDRDDHIIINWENILEDFTWVFTKLRPEQNRLMTEFDDHSIMLFGSRFYAKDPESDKYSMVRKDGSYIEDIYERTSKSRLDTWKIYNLYKCDPDIYGP